MQVLAQSEAAIDRALGILRWQNRVCGAVTGAFFVFFAVAVPLSIWGPSSPAAFQASVPYILLAGAALGLVLVHRYWRRLLGRLASSFLKVDGDHLEVQGLMPGGFGGGMGHVRFRLDEIVVFQLGRQGHILTGTIPAAQALDRAALVIGDKSGAVVVLEVAGVVFDREDLIRLSSYLAQRRASAESV